MAQKQAPHPRRKGSVVWATVLSWLSSLLLALLALTRAGIRHFWSARGRASPQLLVLEGLPIALLLLACGPLVWQAGAVMRYPMSLLHI